LPLLTAISDFIGLVGGCVAAVFSLRLGVVQVSGRERLMRWICRHYAGHDEAADFRVHPGDSGLLQRLTVRGGTQGVGRATTQAVVVSSVLIIVADTFLTKLALYLAGKLF